eukprot:gene8343-9244_t
MDTKDIPRDVTCAQVGQKWHVPSGANNVEDKAFEFSNFVFEKAEEGKKQKRPLVKGDMDFYCATPPFARETTSNELQSLTEKLRLAGKASLFCEALESNQFPPCNLLDTSCSKAITGVDEQQNDEESESSHKTVQHPHPI